MAVANRTTAPGKSAGSASTSAPIFQPFGFIYSPEAPVHSGLLEVTKKISAGIRTALEIVHVANLDAQRVEDEGEGHPIMSAFHAERLLLLAIGAAELLENHVDKQIDAINRHQPARGAA